MAEANISKKRAKQAELVWHVFLRSKAAAFYSRKNIIENVSKPLIKHVRCTTMNLSAEEEMLQ